jgi:hypothetical protein
MKLFLLLYADDTVIFAESQQELQQILKLFEHYCNIWKLKVNISKKKIVVFSKKKKLYSVQSEILLNRLNRWQKGREINFLPVLHQYRR